MVRQNGVRLRRSLRGRSLLHQRRQITSGRYSQSRFDVVVGVNRWDGGWGGRGRHGKEAKGAGSERSCRLIICCVVYVCGENLFAIISYVKNAT